MRFKAEESNVRFWVYLNGWVKLTLRPQQYLEHDVYEETEEGWNMLTVRLFYNSSAQTVTFESISDGTDCDGRIKEVNKFMCVVSDIMSHDMHGIKVPAWQMESHSVRDYAAERAGY